MIEPNDLPIVCLPTDLSDDAAAELVDFLHALTDAIERHYAGQLLRHTRIRDQLRRNLGENNDEPF